jgi:multisubunit Na+/H+ antiporter MnhF subunit
MTRLWMFAMFGLILPMLAPVALSCRGGLGSRVVALQFATVLTSFLLICMTFAFDQSAFIDLPLALSLLTVPGTLLVALVLERWI